MAARRISPVYWSHQVCDCLTLSNQDSCRDFGMNRNTWLIDVIMMLVAPLVVITPVTWWSWTYDVTMLMEQTLSSTSNTKQGLMKFVFDLDGTYLLTMTIDEEIQVLLRLKGTGHDLCLPQPLYLGLFGFNRF